MQTCKTTRLINKYDILKDLVIQSAFMLCCLLGSDTCQIEMERKSSSGGMNYPSELPGPLGFEVRVLLRGLQSISLNILLADRRQERENDLEVQEGKCSSAKEEK